jgi:nucleoside phosphorylase
MPMEIKPLIEKLSLEKQQLGDVSVRAGTLGGRNVVAIVTGMGTKLATEGTTRLLDAVPVDRVVVVGITGAVDDVTPIGTLILPEVVVDSATGAEHRPSALGEGTPHGRMLTGDKLLTDLDAIAGLRAEGVVSLEMETAAIARVCEGRGIPWSVFRVISDRATDGTITEEVFELSHMDGTPNKQAIARYFAKHPGNVPRMARMAKEAKLAADAAADAAIRACLAAQA